MLRNPTNNAFGLKGRCLLVILGVAASMPVFLEWAWMDSLESLLLVDEPARRLEARVTHPLADRHRPYLKTAPLPPRASLKVLGWLERRKETRALAASYLIRSQSTQARLHLPPSPTTPDSSCDLAVVALLDPDDASDLAVAALLEHQSNEALCLLDHALQKMPKHPQALWNRALALRELGLSSLAADAFDQVSRLGEPGWSAEASMEASRLRQGFQERKQAWAEISEAGSDPDKLAAPSKSSALARLPGTARAAFYMAVRSSTNPDQVLRLLPLARELDRQQGDHALENHVREVANHDFRARAELARGYSLLIQGKLREPKGFLERARQSGESDIYLGALLYQKHQKHLEERQAQELMVLLMESEDPWLKKMAVQVHAMHDLSARRTGKAVERLSQALAECDEQRFAYRCLDLAKTLTDLYISLERHGDAQELASKSILLAMRTGEWSFERTFLQELGSIAKERYQGRLARVYLLESLERDPTHCRHFHENMADLAMLDFDIQGEQWHLAQVLAKCKESLSPLGIYLLAERARFNPSKAEADQFYHDLAELRRIWSEPGMQAWLLFIEGQFEIEHDRARGRQLLHQAITEAKRLPTDPYTQDARAQSYSTLIIDAGRAEDLKDVLELVAADRQISVPERCAVVVEDDHSRVLIVVRGSDGKVLRHFDEGRRAPLGSGHGVIPESLLRSLEGCLQVQVIASPSAQASTELLPPERSWSYLVKGSSHPSSTRGKRLVVHNVEPPRVLKLPSLPVRHSSPGTPPPVELQGRDATPSRVLTEMQDATEIEIHAHGLERPQLFSTPFIALTPDKEGNYALTGDEIGQHALKKSPVVFLAACRAARRHSLSHQSSFGLPMAFLDAGASVVVAATVDIPDSAGRFFEAVAARIRSGAPPAVALGAERAKWLAAKENWVKHVLIFE